MKNEKSKEERSIERKRKFERGKMNRKTKEDLKDDR
jgi:hypothetical protein